MSTFPKTEKLCGQLRIQNLYHEGDKLVVWPLRVSYRFHQSPNVPTRPTQVLIWAPKSIFKHAVDRNRTRRLIREAYRLHKDTIAHKGWELTFNYMNRQLPSFEQIEKAMIRAIKKLQIEEEKQCQTPR